MTHFKHFTLLFVLLFAVVLSVYATSTTIVLTDPVAVGSTGTATTDEAYIGIGSWANNGAKLGLNMTPDGLFGYDFGISDIADISYHTFKNTAQNGVNFYINIYTDPDGIDDDASWYGHRITFEPLYAYNFNDALGVWNTWTTSSGTNQVTAFDSNHTVIGFYNGPTLADLQAGSLDWGTYPTSGSTDVIDYSGESVKFIVLDTGNPWAASFVGYVDGITISLTNGDSATVDLDIALTVDDCKNGGWANYGFRNQGACVSAVVSNRDDN